MANEQVTEYWNSFGAEAWGGLQREYDLMLERVEPLLEEAAAAKPGERVLDVGCGAGTTALAMGDAVGADGWVLGVDISDPLLSIARKRIKADGVSNVEVRRLDAQSDELPAESFHLAVSRFGTLFFDDPVAAYANIASALRPSGRLVFMTWQPIDFNEWLVVSRGAMESVVGTLPESDPSIPDTMRFADEAYVRSLLAETGFTSVEIQPDIVPMVFGGGDGLDAAVRHVTTGGRIERVLTGLDDETRTRVLAALSDAFVEHLHGHGVVLGGAVNTVTARKAT